MTPRIGPYSVASPPTVFPVHWRPENYAEAWRAANFPRFFLNSAIISITTVLGTLATSVLARTVHSAAVVTAPRSTAVRLKHFEFLSISDMRILIVLVGHDGTVNQQILTLEESWDQESLSSLAARLNAAFQRKTGALPRTPMNRWSRSGVSPHGLPPGELSATPTYGPTCHTGSGDASSAACDRAAARTLAAIAKAASVRAVAAR